MKINGTIDLETLDTKPSATILSVGCVKFNPYDTQSEPYDALYIKISVDDQNKIHRTYSEDTLAWWSKQDKSIMEEAFDQSQSLSCNQAAQVISKWCNGVDILWGQGYGFDFTILEDFFKAVNHPCPWNFWQLRDSRTLFKLLEQDPRKEMQQNLHNALEDAYYQSKAIQVACEKLEITKISA